jgi:aromatic ring-opening dioxygenase catalytic subunit (LigB family)
MTDRVTLEKAILALGRDAELLKRFKAAPASVGAQLGVDPRWSEIIFRGDRDSLRMAGVNDGITILVSRWFRDDLGDSGSQGTFKVDGATSVAAAPWPENLVFAGACSHVPDLLARPEIDDPEAVSRLLSGYGKLQAAIQAADPEVLVVTTDCHFQVFETGAFVVGTGAQHTGSMAFFKRPDINLELKGDPAFANQLVEAVRACGSEIEAAPEVQLDHGLIVPLRLLLSKPDLPIVPIVTQPARSFSPFNARALGNTLREVIERSGRRVGILATGGLSHWLDPGKFGFIDKDFDGYILDLIRAGRGLDLANLEPYPLLSHGQYEILNWIIMLGAVGGGTRGDVYAYEPCDKSGGGWTVVNMQASKGSMAHA